MFFVQWFTPTFGSTTEMYCVQHGAGTNTSDYQIKHFIQIKGNKVTKYEGIGGGLQAKNITNSSNAILAYILNEPVSGEGYGFNSYARHYALRKHFSTWIDNVGRSMGIEEKWKWGSDLGNEFKDKGEEFYKKARQEAGANNAASIKAAKKTINVKKPNPIPITLTFNGTLSSITVKDENDTTINNNQLEFKQDNRIVSLGEIKSGRVFYMKSKNNQSPEEITFKVENSGVYYANIWLVETTGYLRQYALYTYNKDKKQESQRYMIVEHGKEKTSAKVTIKVNYEDASITINKVDEDNPNKDLEGAKFIIKKPNGKWLTVNDDGTYGESSNKDNAKIFRTSNTGQTKIKAIPNGRYEIYEVGAPIGYQLSLQIGYNGAAYDTTNKWVYQGPITIRNKEPVSIEITNKLYKGTIRINKRDPLGNALDGAEFILYLGGNKFLGKNDDDSWNYAATRSNAFKFTTTDGTIRITNLQIRTYYIWEIDAPDGYELKKQDGYKTTYEYEDANGKKQTVNFKYVYNSTDHKVKLTKDTTSKTVKFVNIQEGSLTITKKDADTGENLDGAQFIIHLGKNKFLGKNSKGNWRSKLYCKFEFGLCNL